jgi:6-phosphogluconolactonase
MFAYVGSHTTEKRNARGAGITIWSIDHASGEWSLVQTVRDLVNPSRSDACASDYN